jgi:DNA-binding XRE family transcriptional regulator
MNYASFNHLRTFRQRPGLTEDELAFLINQHSPTAIARIEAGRRCPDLQGALALQVVFRQEPRQLFPGLYERVEEGVMRRAKFLIDRLGNRTDRRSLAKRDFLSGLARGGNSIEA